MPRLDNSDPTNLTILQEWGGRHWNKVEFNPDDPGAMPAMDVCFHCWNEMFADHDDGTVEHPPYDGEGYRCACCQDMLSADDDHPDEEEYKRG